MIRHPLRHFLLLCCLLFGLAGATSSLAGLPREQSLVAGSMPKFTRGAKASISFTAILSFTSIVKQVTFYSPDGVVIVGVGPGSTGRMFPCQAISSLPSNYIGASPSERRH